MRPGTGVATLPERPGAGPNQTACPQAGYNKRVQTSFRRDSLCPSLLRRAGLPSGDNEDSAAGPELPAPRTSDSDFQRDDQAKL
jgi:hypothetical protein